MADTTVEDLTAAIAVHDAPTLVKLRKAAMAFATEAKVAGREWDELFDPASFTPEDPMRVATVQIRRASESQKFKAADVAKILSEGKK